MPANTRHRTVSLTPTGGGSGSPAATGAMVLRDPNITRLYSINDQTTRVKVVMLGDSLVGFSGEFPRGIERNIAMLRNPRSMPYPAGGWRAAQSSSASLSVDTPGGTILATSFGGVGTTLANTNTMAHTASGDGLRVFWQTNASGGTLTVRDGGAGGTILGTIDTTTGTGDGNVTSYTGLSFGSRQWHITSAGNCIVDGIYTVNGTASAGWEIYYAGKPGTLTNDYNSSTKRGIDLITNVQPNVVILCTGTNDVLASTYLSEMQTLITAVKAAAPNSDIILWCPYNAKGITLTANWLSLVNTNAIGGINAATAFGQVIANNNTWALSSDNVHEGSGLASAFADQIIGVLMGDPIGWLYGMINHGYRDMKANVITGGGDFNAFGQTSMDFAISQYAASATAGRDAQPQVSMRSSLFGGQGGTWYGPGSGTAVRTMIGDAGVAAGQLIASTASGATTMGDSILKQAYPINAQVGTSYTLVAADQEKLITMNNAGAITLTVPTNASVAFPIGTRIRVQQLGAGAVTVTGAGPPTINCRAVGKKTNGQFATIELLKYLTDTWVVTGDIV